VVGRPQLAATLIDGGALKRRSGRPGQIRRPGRELRQTILVAFQQIEDALVQQRVLCSKEQVSAPPLPPRRECRTVCRSISTPRHRALHHRGDDPDRRLTPSKVCSMSRTQRLTTSANLVLALGGGWRDTDLPAPMPIGGLDQTPQRTPNAQSIAPQRSVEVLGR